MNYFSPNTAAERYAKGRPNFHHHTIRCVKEFLKLENKINSALDVACGTGLSTQELLSIAEHVDGTDSSQAMLDLALQKDKINYQLACAEKQPFADDTFDLITVCSGVHWFKIDHFLLEAKRLLKSKSLLIIYDNFFLAEMKGNPNFKDWYENIYLKKFQAPPRNDQYNWTKEKLFELKFDYIKEEKFVNEVSFSKDELVLYLTTQSNIISKVEKEETTYEEVENWLNEPLQTFFNNEGERCVFQFGNWIKYLQKI